MQNKSVDVMLKKRKAHQNLICIVWARVFGEVLGTTMRLMSCRMMSTNVYLFGMQMLGHLYQHVSVEFPDINTSKIELRKNEKSLAKSDC